jgi:NADH:ubiquinone oxidoreductase subunit H
MLLKEVVIPSGADKPVFLLAPLFAFAPGACCLGGHPVQ